MGQTSHQPASDHDRAVYKTVSGFAPDAVFHGFFTRQGGVSAGFYASLNCGRGSSDERAFVIENLSRVASASGVVPNNLLSLHQVHSADCLAVHEPFPDPDNRPQADALVTDQPGLALGVLTADCAPVLFYGQKEGGAPVIGAAHAGWGGAFKGILDSTVKQMIQMEAKLESIKACIGPCIAQGSYEVGVEFIERFMKQDERNEVFFKDGKDEQHFMFDLSGYCAARLSQAGVKTVIIQGDDTYKGEDEYFSYRRATHRREADYGRQISVISIHRDIRQ